MSLNIRLDKLLANMGYGSRREIQWLAGEGLITLDGHEIKKADQRIQIDDDFPKRMHIEDEPLDPLPGMVLMMHKPLGVTCSHKDAGKLIYELLPKRWRMRKPAISTIGRLDKETSGIILLTDDGQLLHRAIAPKSQLEKRYRVTLERPLNGNEADIFMRGTLMLEGESKPLLPAKFMAHDETHATVVLTEGRYHQVRRMFAAVGNHVSALHRDQFGALVLPEDLAAGEYRVMENPETEIFGA